MNPGASGPEVGWCGARGPQPSVGVASMCDLPHGHPGMHEGPVPGEPGVLAPIQKAHWDTVPLSTEEEWCVQYRCRPGMNDWQEWQGSKRHARKWAEIELDARREEEFDPAVEYRLVRRTVTAWEEA